MKNNVIGMDIAKNVFQLHSVNTESGEIERIKLRRDEVLAFFAQRTPALVAIEACGSAHEWARQLRALGHQVRLLAPKSVRPFVLRNKTVRLMHGQSGLRCNSRKCVLWRLKPSREASI